MKADFGLTYLAEDNLHRFGADPDNKPICENGRSFCQSLSPFISATPQLPRRLSVLALDKVSIGVKRHACLAMPEPPADRQNVDAGADH